MGSGIEQSGDRKVLKRFVEVECRRRHGTRKGGSARRVWQLVGAFPQAIREVSLRPEAEVPRNVQPIASRCDVCGKRRLHCLPNSWYASRRACVFSTVVSAWMLWDVQKMYPPRDLATSAISLTAARISFRVPKGMVC